MAKKSDPIGGFQQIEQQAFHAFREWPLWLVLRMAELKREIVRKPQSKAGGNS